MCHSLAEQSSLDAALWSKGNHPSFNKGYGEDNLPPGPEILAGYHKKGYSARYSSLFEAERKHGKILISP